MSHICGYKRFIYWPWPPPLTPCRLGVPLMRRCKPLYQSLGQPVTIELNFSRLINSNLNAPVATIVSVGKEPGPIDFPIVDHTVAFLVHFRQLFRAENKWGMRLRNKAIKTCLPVVPGKSELAQIILNIEKFFSGDVREAAIHFILIHSLQSQNDLMIFLRRM